MAMLSVLLFLSILVLLFEGDDDDTGLVFEHPKGSFSLLRTFPLHQKAKAILA